MEERHRDGWRRGCRGRGGLVTLNVTEKSTHLGLCLYLHSDLIMLFQCEWAVDVLVCAMYKYPSHLHINTCFS